ncbi:MAG: hypothetical protein JNL28_01125 [Planctomycetes bacterium]|nr:hypothetical protein [Planctomycetota bacterium]
MEKLKRAEGRATLSDWLRGAVCWLFLAPSAWLIAFGSLVIRARLRVGEWPHAQSGTPFDGTWVDTSIDPKEFGLHHMVVWCGLGLTAWAVVIGAGVWVASLFWPRIRPPLFLRLLFIATAVACVAVVFGDVGGFFEWFLD